MASERPRSGSRRRAMPARHRGLLAGMRIRKKLIVLHTAFSLGLAGLLLVALRPALAEVVVQAEQSQAQVLARLAAEGTAPVTVDGSAVRTGTPEELGLDATAAAEVRAARGAAVTVRLPDGVSAAAAALADGRVALATVRIPGAREAAARVYWIVTAALVSAYLLVALSLELFVLPQHVYGPISRMLSADRAVQEGRAEHELIPEPAIPADELGEIMRSRNESIAALRRNQMALAEALGQLEVVAADLKLKNDLIEAARRNLADADRLASLGMMSAGIAHELNTPLAVLKGVVEDLAAEPGRGIPEERAALMLRVVGRLERLSEGLLDFARVRPPRSDTLRVRELVEEALALVRLDPERSGVALVNAVPDAMTVRGDGDRLVQVLVNLVRNGADAMRREGAAEGGAVRVDARVVDREGRPWVAMRIRDDGPGIDPDVLPRLFEPFVSTRMDAHGTGLGLAVAEGIVREHGGAVIAGNRQDGRGAVLEILLPDASGNGGAGG